MMAAAKEAGERAVRGGERKVFKTLRPHTNPRRNGHHIRWNRQRLRRGHFLGSAGRSALQREVPMKRVSILAALTAFALMMGTGAAMAFPCGGSNCVVDEPIVTTPPQDNCGNSGCAVPEPQPFQTADPCPTSGCAVPEPAPFQTAAGCAGSSCDVPEPDETQPA